MSVGNADLDTIVGSRVIEVDYTSPPGSDAVGNFLSTGLTQICQSCGARVVEVEYISTP